MKGKIFCLSFLFSLLIPFIGFSQPALMTAQGVLRDSEGKLVNKTLNLKFSIYKKADNSLLWSEEKTGVPVKNGVFNVILNFTGNEKVFLENDDLLLGLKVGTEPELPKVPLTSVGFAIKALRAKEANALLGKLPWSQLTDVPKGLDDGDQDTTYNAGTGILLNKSTNTFSSDPAYIESTAKGVCFDNQGELDPIYVNVTGDNMTGNLTVQGNVGIGTTAPIEKLTITEGNLRFGQAPTTFTTTTADVDDTTITIPVVSTSNYPSAGTILIDSEAITYTGTTATAFTGATRGALGTSAATHSAGATVKNYLFTALASATIPRMVITGDGNVGIGTRGPVEKLDIAGGLRTGLAPTTYTITTADVSFASTTIPVFSTSGYPSAGTILIDSEAITYTGTTATAFTGATRGALGTSAAPHSAGATVKNYLFTALANATTPRMVITGDGNVGIGTTEPGAKLEVAGQLKITGGSPGANKVLTSDAAGLASWQTSVPPGGIIMYSGEWKNFDETGLGKGPLEGWALCNGNNGTPDLTDRFVMGTTNKGNLGSTGGANSYSLTEAQLPSHSHSISPDGSHSHSYHRPNYAAPVDTGGWYHCSNAGYTDTTSKVDDHAHGKKTGDTGEGKAIDNRPAFIQLAFIMKL